MADVIAIFWADVIALFLFKFEFFCQMLWQYDNGHIVPI